MIVNCGSGGEGPPEECLQPDCTARVWAKSAGFRC